MYVTCLCSDYMNKYDFMYSNLIKFRMLTCYATIWTRRCISNACAWRYLVMFAVFTDNHNCFFGYHDEVCSVIMLRKLPNLLGAEILWRTKIYYRICMIHLHWSSTAGWTPLTNYTRILPPCIMQSNQNRMTRWHDEAGHHHWPLLLTWTNFSPSMDL